MRQIHIKEKLEEANCVDLREIEKTHYANSGERARM